MAYLAIAGATKQFGPDFRALDDVSISVERGEFFTLLHPVPSPLTDRIYAGYRPTSATSAWSFRTMQCFPT